MKNILNALILFGKELPWELDTALFWLLVAQVTLIMFMVVVFAVLIHRVGRRNDNITVVVKDPIEEENKLETEVAGTPRAEGPSVEFPEELIGSWGIEGHDGIRVVIGTSTLSVDGVVATDITATETEGEYAFKLGDVEHTVFLKRARKHTEASAEDAAVTGEAAETETPEVTEEAETAEVVTDAKEEDDNLRLINGGEYSYAKLYKWVEAAAPEAEAKPLVITFPDSLRGDWVVEGHESVHVLIEEHKLFIDGIEVTEITLDAEKPTEYMFKVNGLDYIVAYGTSDKGGFRNISGGEFKACALVEPFVEEPEKVEYTITVEAPEGLPAMQLALFNGENQVGSAVAITDGTAKITAVPGDYGIKLFGLPEEYYAISDYLSPDVLEGKVVIQAKPVVEEEPEPVPEPVVVVAEEPAAPQKVEYNIAVTAPEGLHGLQVALINGDTQVCAAVNVVDGTATILAMPADYTVKVFNVPENYDVVCGTVSADRHLGTVTITEIPMPEEVAAPEPEVIDVAPIEEAPAEEPAPARKKPATPDEESFKAGTVRYDRSFTARLIQSETEIKDWYTELKNDLLSYKKVHDRMSWKRESYNFGREPVARLAYRGNTLCLFLPLNVAEFIDTKYKVEDESDNASYADTPLLYRIKNNKRVKYAKELIAIVMEKIGAERFERESQDYFMPYEGVVELMKKGLIKRNVKDDKAEIFFEERRIEDSIDVDSLETESADDAIAEAAADLEESEVEASIDVDSLETESAEDAKAEADADDGTQD